MINVKESFIILLSILLVSCYTEETPYSNSLIAMAACQARRDFITAYHDVVRWSTITIFNVNRVHRCRACNVVILSYANMGDDIGPNIFRRFNNPKSYNCNVYGHTWDVDHFWSRRALPYPPKYRRLAWHWIWLPLGCCNGTHPNV